MLAVVFEAVVREPEREVGAELWLIQMWLD